MSQLEVPIEAPDVSRQPPDHLLATFFQTTGYLKIPDLLEPDQVEHLREAAYSASTDAGTSSLDGSSDMRRVDQVVSADPAFMDVASSASVLRALTSLLGPNIELVTNRHNHVTVLRTPTVGRLHRDILQWSRSILTVLIYLSDCTESASATRVVPGSHLWPCRGAPNNGGTWLDEAAPYMALGDQAVAVMARAGDALLLHGQLYHARAGGSAASPRVVLTLAYRSVDELAGEAAYGCQLVSGRRIHRGRGATRVWHLNARAHDRRRLRPNRRLHRQPAWCLARTPRNCLP